jgi:hypothetical protein
MWHSYDNHSHWWHDAWKFVDKCTCGGRCKCDRKLTGYRVQCMDCGKYVVEATAATAFTIWNKIQRGVKL